MNKRAPEKAVNLEQRPDVEVDKGMSEEGKQPYSQQEYDLCQDFKKEEFEGRILALGHTSFDVTANKNAIILQNKLRAVQSM